MKQTMVELRGGVNWSSLGDQLGLPDWEKRVIEQSSSDEQRRLMKVLDWWINSDSNVTWTRLAAALEKMHLYKLKDRILWRYCPVRSSGGLEMTSTDGRLDEDQGQEGKHPLIYIYIIT